MQLSHWIPSSSCGHRWPSHWGSQSNTCEPHCKLLLERKAQYAEKNEHVKHEVEEHVHLNVFKKQMPSEHRAWPTWWRFFQVNELFTHCPDHHHRVCHRCHQLARPAKEVVAVTLAQIWNKADMSNKIKWFDTYFKTVQRQNYSNITAKPLLSLTTLHAMRETVPSYTHDALLRPWPLSLGSCPEWSWRSWTWFSLLPVPVLSLPDH